MLLIPAIDIREGRCVRLVEGRPDRQTVYSDQPLDVAKSWQQQGAQYLHVVDLDGAFAGIPRNLAIINEIVSELDIPVQVGGGIRDYKTIQLLLHNGVSRVILGTAAISDPDLVRGAVAQYRDKIVVGIDARDGKVAVQGWAVESVITAEQLALQMKQIGVSRIVFTDISRDGTLRGPNLEATGQLARTTGLKVIASGGVSSYDDIRRLKSLHADGVEGAIIGKALYDGKIDFKSALQLVAQGE